MNARMQENFLKLEERVYDSLNETDLEKINYELSKINTPTIVTGVGGSSVVSTFASKVLNEKNKIISIDVEPRDLKYMNLYGFNNILSCSYSGINFGVDLAFENNLKHYLLSSKENNKEGITNLTYNCESEHSFISLAATLIPCSILFNYYLSSNYLKNNSSRIIDNYLDEYSFDFDIISDIYEIFSGKDTCTASKYLESTMVESGIGIPIVHDKYGYCHGRSTISTTKDSIAIYFNTNKELDKLLIDLLNKYYKQVIILDSFSSIEGDFHLLIKCMYLTKYIAESQNKDLSRVEYSPMVKKLYRYKGEI